MLGFFEFIAVTMSVSTLFEVVGENCLKKAFDCDHRFGKLTDH
jgi:hypothetical protein